MSSLPHTCRRAIAVVAARATGEPLDHNLRVTVNFQPDRRINGVWVLERLADEGLYRSQFETGHSSGAVPVDPSCPERAQFEHDNFGGAYDGIAPEHRPKYGALDFMADGFGAAPWYGSAHIRLSERVLNRTTFCYPDSAAHPTQFGSAAACDLVPHARADLAAGIDPIKVYVEAHVHGPLKLSDVEALVLDPSFRDTATHTQAHALDVPIEWNSGIAVETAVLRAQQDFRGPAITDLAYRLARNGVLTPACLTSAAADGTDPRTLRKVWHYLARFGIPQREIYPASPIN